MKPNAKWLLPGLAIGGGFLAPHLALGFYPNVQWIGFSGDYFVNYDFTTKDDRLPAEKVDWPINMVWWKNANINDVKAFLDSHGWFKSGQTEHARVWESGNSPQIDWDSDRGFKADLCEVPYSTWKKRKHTRLYAPTGNVYYDRFYSTEFGYSIIASTHYDINHTGNCDGGQEWIGWSEDVEAAIANLADNYYTVWPDYQSINMLNSGNGVYDFRPYHYHQSSGYATFVKFT